MQAGAGHTPPQGLRIARAAASQGAFMPLMGALVALAWVALVIWERSPYGRYLDHGNWTEIGLAATLCRALPAGSVLVPGLLYVGGWLLMSAAMMLPSTLPLLTVF